MFLRKLFKVSDKLKWLFLELLVVFIGVYLAFLFQGYAEGQKINKEKLKVLSGLKLEIEEFRISFEGYANYQDKKVKEWDSIFANNEVAQYYGWRYLEPQYDFKIIEYALNQEGTDAISFDLYAKLSDLYSSIKKLEHAERLMTELGMKYNLIPQSLDSNSSEIKLLAAENRFNFYKFTAFARDRASALHRIGRDSEEIVNMINKELGPKEAERVEFNLLKKYVDAKVDRDFLEETFGTSFPKYSKERLNEMIEEIEMGENPIENQ